MAHILAIPRRGLNQDMTLVLQCESERIRAQRISKKRKELNNLVTVKSLFSASVQNYFFKTCLMTGGKKRTVLNGGRRLNFQCQITHIGPQENDFTNTKKET